MDEARIKRLKNFEKVFVCDTCAIVFTINSPYHQNKTPYCPSCGENLDVRRYVKEKGSVGKGKVKWREEEMEVIDRCINGKIARHQAAIILGRSADSVANKMKRRKVELENATI